LVPAEKLLLVSPIGPCGGTSANTLRNEIIKTSPLGAEAWLAMIEDTEKLIRFSRELRIRITKMGRI
jgi:hypothetical protein